MTTCALDTIIYPYYDLDKDAEEEEYLAAVPQREEPVGERLREHGGKVASESMR